MKTSASETCRETSRIKRCVFIIRREMKEVYYAVCAFNMPWNQQKMTQKATNCSKKYYMRSPAHVWAQTQSHPRSNFINALITINRKMLFNMCLQASKGVISILCFIFKSSALILKYYVAKRKRLPIKRKNTSFTKPHVVPNPSGLLSTVAQKEIQGLKSKL